MQTDMQVRGSTLALKPGADITKGMAWKFTQGSYFHQKTGKWEKFFQSGKSQDILNFYQKVEEF